MAANQEVVKRDFKGTAAQRFAALVEREMQSKFEQGLELTDEQKRLIQNYFIAIDKALATAENARMRKSEKYRDPVPYNWQNVDLKQIATDVVHFSRLGLDPCQKNNLFVIPYKNKNTNIYDINFMTGYVGLELITKKYALEVPLDVTVELVYSNDTFKEYKKGRNQPCDDYDFEITNPFDRGEVLGGFAYIQYREPAKNKLIVMPMAEIIKRKNAGQGNPEFWGGEKDEWANGKKTGNKVQIDGWFEEMCLKTIKRKVYGGNVIPIDPRLIDESYRHIKQREQDNAYAEQQEVFEAETASIVIDDYSVNTETGEATEIEEVAELVPEPQEQAEPEAMAQTAIEDFDEDPGY